MKYYLYSDEKTLHGFLSSSLEPVLRIHSGDSVVFQTIDPDWRVSDTNITSTHEGNFSPARQENDKGHALCGPVYIHEADIGKTLAITVRSLHSGCWGWSRFGGGDEDHLRRMNYDAKEYFLHWSIDREHGVCRSNLGHEVTLKPFMGVYTVAPNSEAIVPTHQPGAFGGNLDCKEIGEGAILYLPIFAKGALFSTGDGHAAQGDGELGGTAIEAPMDAVELEFEVKDFTLERPICRTKSGWLTFGFSQDLTDASYIAVNDMIRLMEHVYKISYSEAVALASTVVDLRITQIVNRIRGVHAYLPDGAIRFF